VQYLNKTQQILGCSPLLSLLLSVPLFSFPVGGYPLGKGLSSYRMGYKRDHQIPVQRKSWLTRHGELPMKILLFQPTLHLFTCLHEEKKAKPTACPFPQQGAVPAFYSWRKAGESHADAAYLDNLDSSIWKNWETCKPSHLAISRAPALMALLFSQHALFTRFVPVEDEQLLLSLLCRENQLIFLFFVWRVPGILSLA